VGGVIRVRTMEREVDAVAGRGLRCRHHVYEGDHMSAAAALGAHDPSLVEFLQDRFSAEPPPPWAWRVLRMPTHLCLRGQDDGRWTEIEFAHTAPHYPEEGWTAFCAGCASAAGADRQQVDVLIVMAQFYADHPDFAEVWRS
jgi:hypothetical protein